MNPATTSTDSSTTRHPRGLYTLFFTEMWERCSYYGMRALLILFMTAAIQTGGLGMNEKLAGAIYGLYTAAVYLAALPGGWVADRLLGAQRAVWVGGWLIAAGQFTLAVPRTDVFFVGLLLVVLGTGLLKPNVSTMVGHLYPEGGARRDSGFTLFYMGINLGATVGPLICGWLGEKVNWRLGFAVAGLGMVGGLIQYRLTRHHLGAAGAVAPHDTGRRRHDWGILGGAMGVLVLLVVLLWTGVVRVDAVAIAQLTKWVILGLALVFFLYVLLLGKLDALEKKRVGVIAILFIASATFWSGFEQAGSSLNLFAERHTLRLLAGWEIPAGWFQSLNPLFVITLAPVVAAAWLTLARRNWDLSLPVKFAVGLALLGGGFLVMAAAAKLVVQGNKVWPTWLIATYLMHSIGELCLSPVGLSSVTKLAPKRFVGQMMGVWFLATSLGNLIAGLIAGEVSGDATNQMPARFFQIVLTTCGASALLLIFAKPIKRLMSGTQ